MNAQSDRKWENGVGILMSLIFRFYCLFASLIWRDLYTKVQILKMYEDFNATSQRKISVKNDADNNNSSVLDCL